MSSVFERLDHESIALKIEHAQYHAASLLLYASVLETPVGAAFINLMHRLMDGLHGNAGSTLDCISAYGQWFRTLADTGQSWQEHVLTQLLTTENSFTRYVRHGTSQELPSALLEAVRHDLSALHYVSQCTGEQISQWVNAVANVPSPPVAWVIDEQCSPWLSTSQSGVRSLPIWKTLRHHPCWADCVTELVEHYRRYGTGITAQYWALRWQDGALVGISNHDPIRLDELAAYDSPRQALIQNTEALLSGYRALHVLLYGSRGSGKSSLVKALLNAYGDRGLRLIEVGKQELQALPFIVDQIRNYPQKFIIFVDDLSFEEDDDAFKALKVVLEGSLTARPQNVVVYATSNRRHLIREFHGDRPRPKDADEIHAWDTVQEKLSFSDRFGLTLTFEPADQATYLTIIHHLAKHENIPLSSNDLEYRALQWATRHNGRSGRTARQFIDALKAELYV